MIAMAGFSVLIIGMVTRTALGHLGRPLAADRSILASYVLVLVAVALRLGAVAPAAASMLSLQLAAAAWIAAWALYIGALCTLADPAARLTHTTRIWNRSGSCASR